MAIHPRLSPPTEYELLALLMGTFVSTALLLLTSSTPTTRAMCPAPSASNMPPSVTAPLASKPCMVNAYCPFRSDSWPDPQVMAGAELIMVMLRFCTANCAPALLESVAFTVKLVVPLGPAGVPVMCPEESMLNPAGKLPLLTFSVTIPAPPEVATVWPYGAPCVPAGSHVVVTDGPSVMLTATDADFVESVTDVAVTVAVAVLPELG